MAGAEKEKRGEEKYQILKNISLTLLRMAIGWHFLYEGLVKLTADNWSSASYLASSRWLLEGLFDWIVARPSALAVVDQLNIWGLLLIGMGLLIGAFTRAAAVCGMILLALYWIANPPLVGLDYEMFTEGNYLVVDKNLVEMLALFVIAAVPSRSIYGLDRMLRIIRRKKGENGAAPAGPASKTGEKKCFGFLLERRELLKALVSLPVLGGFTYALMKKRGYESWEEKHLLAMADKEAEATTSATIHTFSFAGIKDLKGTLPRARIGDLEMSRVTIGGNLIAGWAHARDLIYVNKLIKAYHSERKVFETLKLAEMCGVNTIITNPALCRIINEYWRKAGGKIQFVSDCEYHHDLLDGVRVSVDAGAASCFVQGAMADRLIREGNFELIGRTVELIRSNGLTAGIGAHEIGTIKACVKAGMKPDYWFKTLHHTDYWSATPRKEHDNIWCTDPETTIEYMNKLEQPWIAFKVLAAGAIAPEVGFPYAFNNGADFICVGMYDFQIVENVNMAVDALGRDLKRRVPWRSPTVA